MTSGRNLLSLSLSAAEQKQFAEALNYTDQALVAFAEDNDLEGYAETYSMKFHVFKHLYSYSNFIGYQYSALANALLGAEIALKHNVSKKYVMLINAAKAYDQAKNIKEATRYYDLAIAAIKENPKSRKAELADTQNHKDALLVSDDPAAEQRILSNIEIIRNSEDISIYERDVWMSGAYLRLAQALKDRNKEKSTEYIAKAKEIIQSNPELVIRKDQLSIVADN